MMSIKMSNPFHTLDGLRDAITARSSIIIGIEGFGDSNRTIFARLLGGQLALPVISLDTYLIIDSAPISWRFGELIRDLQPKVIVEGSHLRTALQAIDRNADIVVETDYSGIPVNGFDQIAKAYFD